MQDMFTIIKLSLVTLISHVKITARVNFVQESTSSAITFAKPVMYNKYVKNVPPSIKLFAQSAVGYYLSAGSCEACSNDCEHCASN